MAALIPAIIKMVMSRRGGGGGGGRPQKTPEQLNEEYWTKHYINQNAIGNSKPPIPAPLNFNDVLNQYRSTLGE